MLERLRKFFAKNWQYLVVFVFGMILTVGVWARIHQTMTGDDYAFHVTRLQSASRAWSNGQILPQVDPDALGGFGYAYNLFYGPLITYVAAGLQAIVGLWPLAINLCLIFCVIGAGLLMCRTMMKISKNQVLATLVAVFLMASPYFLNNLYSRMAVGEVAALVAAPILLLGLYKLTAREKHAARSIAVAAALLLLSHSLSAVLFALMAAIYVVVNWRKILTWENVWQMVVGVVAALGLTAFFTLPMLEAKMTGIYGVFDQGYSEVYFGANPQSMNDHRLWPNQLMVADYTAGADDGLDGENDLALGIIVWIGLIGFWFVRKKIENESERRFVTGLYVAAVLAILLALPIVNWYHMPGILWSMQFPWRSLMIVGVAMSVVSGYVLYSLLSGVAAEKQKVAAVAMGMLAIYMVTPLIVFNPEQRLDSIDEVKEDPVVLGWEAEYAPMKLLCSPDKPEDVKQGYACSLARVRERLVERGERIKVLEGEVKLSDATKDGLRVEFEVDNEGGEALVELPLIYYPGYQAELESEHLRLEVTYSDEYNLVVVKIPEGAKGRVKVRYGLSRASGVGLMISGVTMILGVSWLALSVVYERKKRKKDTEMAQLMDSVREEMEKSEAKTSKLKLGKGKKK